MDEKDLRDVTPRNVLARQGISAVSYLAAGAFLFLMTIGVRARLPGLILPAAALVLGVSGLVSKDRDDRNPGLILCAAGTLGMLGRFGPPMLRPFALFFLGLGAFGLFAAGIWKGIKFLVGLKARS